MQFTKILLIFIQQDKEERLQNQVRQYIYVFMSVCQQQISES